MRCDWLHFSTAASELFIKIACRYCSISKVLMNGRPPKKMLQTSPADRFLIIAHFILIQKNQCFCEWAIFLLPVLKRLWTAYLVNTHLNSTSPPIFSFESYNCRKDEYSVHVVFVPIYCREYTDVLCVSNVDFWRWAKGGQEERTTGKDSQTFHIIANRGFPFSGSISKDDSQW